MWLHEKAVMGYALTKIRGDTKQTTPKESEVEFSASNSSFVVMISLARWT